MSSSNNNSSGAGQGKANGNSSSTGGSGPSTNYAIIKEGWGTRSNFQSSFGLGMTPEGISAGNQILDGMRENDNTSTKSGKK